MDKGVISGSRRSDQAPAGLHPSGFDPSRLVARLKRIETLAMAPGKYSGPAFDEIAALAASCLATIRGGQHGSK